ncbi:MAG: S26 family signal peptidase [Candidatus Thermoplasmatota archaeon]|jgi:signal peptidase|nr:S26 family signal peptidase [Candidatus Thermoplasmatota archaeon]
MKKSAAVPAIIVVIFFVGITLYSGIWPPLTIVSSGSMQHSGSWTPGIITTGDVVYLKKVPDNSAIVTYINGSSTGYTTFGEYGNVIVYDYGGYQIIHRAMFYLGWNGTQPIVYGYSGQPWIKITNISITLFGIGYAGKNLILYLAPIRGLSGFITCGDYNLGNSNLNPSPVADQDQVLGFYDPPVKGNEIVGVAMADLPWLGLLKLWPMWELHLAIPQNPAPLNSYGFLLLLISAVTLAVLSPSILHKKRERENKK